MAVADDGDALETEMGEIRSEETGTTGMVSRMVMVKARRPRSLYWAYRAVGALVRVQASRWR